MASDIHDRLKALRQSLGLSQKAMADKLGIALSAYQNYELTGGRTPKAETLLKLFDLGADLNWFVAGVGEQKKGASMPLPMEDYYFVPRYDVQASAGYGVANFEERVVDFMAFKREWIRDRLGVDPRHLLTIQAIGDSMSPTIRDGDIILVHTNVTHVKENAIYVLNVGGDLMVKRVQKKLDGTLIIISDNPAYERETLRSSEAEQLRVVGQAIWHGGAI